MIVGQEVTLYVPEESTGADGFNTPIVTETEVKVANVLIGEPTSDEIVDATNLYGKRLLCWLAIPKGDTHDWKDKRVSWTDAYGRAITVRTFGFPMTGIEANVPGPWHQKVRCEAFA